MENKPISRIYVHTNILDRLPLEKKNSWIFINQPDQEKCVRSISEIFLIHPAFFSKYNRVKCNFHVGGQYEKILFTVQLVIL